VKKLFNLLLAAVFLLAFLAERQPIQASPSPIDSAQAWANKVEPDVQVSLDQLQSNDMLSVIITMADQADLSQIPGVGRAARLQGVIRALQAKAQASQVQIRAFLTAQAAQGKVGQVTPFWVFNGLSVTATADVLQELAARPDVQILSPDDIQIVPTGLNAFAAPGTNLSLVHASDLWDLGYYGQGVIVANMDSGVDASHPDLAPRWRGGSNSWFDPYGQHPTTPTDLTGHGTQTMGVMVAGDASGTSLGVAPQAQWIAVKIFNDSGTATATAIHQSFQWLLDPDGNPTTADAPQVVNNSWAFGAPGCNLGFQLDLQSLVAAGIMPVFSAGNYGPNASTSVSPANYPEAFAVGETDNADQIANDSSRGPSACGETSSIYPELVAPGVNIHTTDRFGLYTNVSGTSLSAPHVAGALALLLSAYPDLGADYQAAALTNSAADLGAAGPDNTFGYGRLDVLAAYQWILANPAPTSTPTSTPTDTPLPTDTPTPTATPDLTINLALNRPVSVSSIQDSAHDGQQAVDGDLGTYWQTARATGKQTLPAEWLTVDLGTSQMVSQVILEWDASYATSYTLQVSSNGSSWSTVYSTTNGDGANDTLLFSPVSARYVRLNSTAWSSGSQRNWLREFQVYAGGGTAPTATPTSLPTSTATPTAVPSPTATPGASASLHVGDLDGSTSTGNHGRWNSTVTISLHSSSEAPVAGASVSGTWSGGASDSGNCQTDSSGTCSVSLANLKSNISSVTFTITAVSTSGWSYQPSANHDPDGDSDGTTIELTQP
jgi:subtilisin family serine protease